MIGLAIEGFTGFLKVLEAFAHLEHRVLEVIEIFKELSTEIVQFLIQRLNLLQIPLGLLSEILQQRINPEIDISFEILLL